MEALGGEIDMIEINTMCRLNLPDSESIIPIPFDALRGTPKNGPLYRRREHESSSRPCTVPVSRLDTQTRSNRKRVIRAK
jgi:hypothetical protein